MGNAFLFLKARRLLGLWIYDDDFEKRVFEGDVHLERHRLGRMTSGRLSNPMSPKEVIKFLKKYDIFLSRDFNTDSAYDDIEDALLESGFEFYRVKTCPTCLVKGRLSFIDEEPYLFQKREICRLCVMEELKKELAFRKTSKGFFKKFRILLDKYRDFDRVMKILDMDYDPAEDKLTLYDKIQDGDSGETLPINKVDIPKKLKKIIMERGIKNLLPVQALTIENGLLEGQSMLVVSATASGKTLIGELAGVPKALTGKKMLFLVPLVAIANQKYNDFRVYEKLGLKVSIRVGMSRIKDAGGLSVRDKDYRDARLVVGTYESLDFLMREGKALDLGDVGTIIIDEVHMLGEEERGIEIDGIISRLKYFFPEAQLICLSATVGNPKEIAGKYGLKPVIYDKRPIPVERHLILVRDERDKRKAIKRLALSEFYKRSKFGFLGQSLIFTNSRRNTHSLASYLRSRGVKAAEYHAGLSYKKRKGIEKKFLKQELACIVTTAALGAGVDFPASQVIFETLTMGNKWITINEFHQMLGRSGRPLYHDRGKVVLLVEPNKRFSFAQKETEEEWALKLLDGHVEDIWVKASPVEESQQVLANLTATSSKPGLEAITAGMFHESSDIDTHLQELENLGLVKDDKPTELGFIASTGFLEPHVASEMFRDTTSRPLDKLVKLFPFKNAYISQSFKTALEFSYHTRLSSRFFDGIGILFEEPREEFLEIMDEVQREFMFCKCREFPYCPHGEKELSKKILEMRMDGNSVKSISDHLRYYRMQVYEGDIFSYLDDIIRKAESMEKIYRLRGSGKKAKETVQMIRGLE